MFDSEIRELVEAMERHKVVVHKVIDERNALRARVAELEKEVLSLERGEIRH